MFQAYRIRRAQQKFLEASRSLEDEKEHWQKIGKVRTWLFQVVIPTPLLGLHEKALELSNALSLLESTCTRRPLGQHVIQEYHRLLFLSDHPEGAGKYRHFEIKMRNNPLKPPPPRKLTALMSHFENNLSEAQKTFDDDKHLERKQVIRVAVGAYYRLGVIHPFHDGNGRVARLVMNHLLRRYHFGYVIFPKLSFSGELWNALCDAGNGNMKPLEEYAESSYYPI